jgi:uncharacterized iron-regulated membrane protein
VRALFLVHRYLGIAVGFLMVVWCLSGIVMMYVPYPQLSEPIRLQHLAPIDWRLCCTLRGAAISNDGPIYKAQLEMLGTSAVLRWRNAEHRLQVIDAATGIPLTRISEAQARSVAQPYSATGAQLRLLGLIDHDQWTVQGARGADRPLFHFSLGDSSGGEIYVSSVTGKALQITTSRERFWNWLGSVPHWIYFSMLRQHPELWTSVVVWSSTVGCFLTITGLYIGIRQFRPRPYAGWLPYRGTQYWHHVLGLMFGLFLLTWVVSGLVSMNPWGFLDGEPPFAEIARLRGSPPASSALEAGLGAFAKNLQSRAAVSVESAPLNGQVFLIASDGTGERLRTDASGHGAPLLEADFDRIARRIAYERPMASRQLLSAEDQYYFSHHREYARLPVYRIILDDADRTRYYVDAVTGEIVARIDRDARWYRWLHQALHRLDFGAAFRGSVVRDLVMLTLLAGMTVVCGIGAYMGFRRVLRASGTLDAR